MSRPAPTTGTTAKPRRKMSRRRKILFGVIAALFGLSLAISLVEISLRMLDPLGLNYEAEFLRYKNEALRYPWEEQPGAPIDYDGTLYRHKPGFDVDLGSFRLVTNSLGFRGPEIAVEKPPGIVRVLVLGDSVAFGWGVDDEATFLRKFEQELATELGKPVEIINTGHPMYDSVQELALLRDEGLRLQPDLVMLIYVTNDIEPTRDVVEQAIAGKQPDPDEQVVIVDDSWSWLAAQCPDLLYGTSKFLELQSDIAARMAESLPTDQRYVPEQVGTGPRGWTRSKTALLAMRDLCREASVPFVLLDTTKPELEALPTFCRDNDIPYFLIRYTPEELEQPIYNSLLDTHANALGHDILLGKLMDLAGKLPLPR